jgi:hypothetical protein
VLSTKKQKKFTQTEVDTISRQTGRSTKTIHEDDKIFIETGLRLNGLTAYPLLTEHKEKLWIQLSPLSTSNNYND